ncbi:FAD-dependent oxidoreductase [Actinomadura xylanilytica]|uniref:FAD-dependent oxidoreductase n=1 Tax=Actinomadura xylanilytica TaxID=887459 RepID=UPI00255B3E58|nr:NAD(P)/FAD-dependent oxidoreductase [Actinomadura xylanilytica]MDL4773655.1 NAD(P)/FAD-dependent oxidoreductase [Actinomadura xylanilytica]
MRVLVIGAGVGGLATAQGLLDHGHEVRVFEKAPALRTTGAAFTLWSNGTGILGELGVSLDRLGGPVDVLEQRSSDGRRLLTIEVARAARHFGHPHVSLPRRRLLERLAGGLPGGTVAFGRDCTAIGQEDGHAWAGFGGTTVTGDVLVGADGHHSIVRETLWGAGLARPSGWATWQGLGEVPVGVASSRTGLMIVGREGLCGLMPAGDGLLQWWFDLRWTPGEPVPASPIADLRRRFGHWASPVPEVLAAVDEADAAFFPHHRHRVPRTWGEGRITLAGDAAHTMPPTVAQGANQALEDAWALVDALKDLGVRDVPGALRRYERTRSRRAALVSRVAGTEYTNRYRPRLSRLAPDALVSRAYTRWLGLVSGYLPGSATSRPGTR